MADSLAPDQDIRDLCVRFADLPTLVGRPFLGAWHTIDAAKLSLFDVAVCSDQNEYPFDSSGYPEQLVEGFHLLALLDHLLNPLLRFSDGPCIGWNYGLDRVRFVRPVCAGDEVRLTGTVGAVRPKGDGFLTLCSCTVEVKGHDRPGLVADWWTYWLPGTRGTSDRTLSDAVSDHEDSTTTSTFDE